MSFENAAYSPKHDCSLHEIGLNNRVQSQYEAMAISGIAAAAAAAAVSCRICFLERK